MNSGVVAGQTGESGDVIRVLIADPDTDLLAAYCEAFSESLELTTAVSGVDCFARLREQTPDVVVLEPDLPWGGGDGVLAVMHDDDALAAIPVMILTGCRDVEVLRSVAVFSISDYHVKPLPPIRLLTRIHALLAWRAGSGAVPPRNAAYDIPITVGE
jgi:DNA-binding response OmpR family regulator